MKIFSRFGYCITIASMVFLALAASGCASTDEPISTSASTAVIGSQVGGVADLLPASGTTPAAKTSSVKNVTGTPAGNHSAK